MPIRRRVGHYCSVDKMAVAACYRMTILAAKYSLLILSNE